MEVLSEDKDTVELFKNSCEGTSKSLVFFSQIGWNSSHQLKIMKVICFNVQLILEFFGR